MTSRVHIVETSSQRQLLHELLSATDHGTAGAVLDATWPARLRRQARDELKTAADQDRVTDSDLVLFTSGSTARPRGVIRTVSSWQVSVAPLSEILRIGRDDAVWLPGPLWSSLFLYGAWHARAVGAATILRDEDPGSATTAHCVPAQLPTLLEAVQTRRTPRLRLIVVGGDRVPEGLRRRCEDQGVRLVEYYGAAELSFVAWRKDDGFLKAFPGAELDLRNGVVWVRSPYLARAYLATDDDGTWTSDAAGWATVGDLAVQWADGLEVLGRGDGAITTGGHTIAVEEVERLLQAVSGVQDVGVVGLPHAALGQVVVAVVVGDVGNSALRAASHQLPPAARPRRWLHADTLPRTSGGKLRRPGLLQLATSLAAQ